MEITREIFGFPKPDPNVVPTAIKPRSHFVRKSRCLICVDTYQVDVALLFVTRLLMEGMVLPTKCHVVSQCIVGNTSCLEACDQ